MWSIASAVCHNAPRRQSVMMTPALPKLPGADCSNCPGRDQPFVPPESSNGRKSLAIVGEQPGGTELQRGRPFIGASGRLLMKGVSFLGLTRDQVHWTNAVPCKVKDRELTAARKCCASRLVTELGASGAGVIMPVGAHGTRSVLGLKSAPIMAYRGTISRTQLVAGAAPVYVCPTLHPAFVMRAPLWAPVLERDVVRIGRVLRDGWVPPEQREDRRFIYVRRESQLQAALDTMQTQDIGFDVETVGLGPTETLLVCFALSSGPSTVIVPWAKHSAGVRQWWRSPHRIAGIVGDWLEDRIAVTHNGPTFDHIIAKRYGLRIRRWEDTLQAAHALESHLPRGLARVASSYLDVGPWKQQDHSKRLTDLWTYNGRDTLYTILSWRETEKRLDA